MELKFMTSDHKVVKVEWELIRQAKTISSMYENTQLEKRTEELEHPIQIGEELATERIFLKIVEWLKHYKDALPKPGRFLMKISNDLFLEGSTTELTDFDLEFFNLDQDTLFKIIMTANWLDLDSLLDKSTKFLSTWIEGKSTREILEKWNIQPDLFYGEVKVSI